MYIYTYQHPGCLKPCFLAERRGPASRSHTRCPRVPRRPALCFKYKHASKLACKHYTPLTTRNGHDYQVRTTTQGICHARIAGKRKVQGDWRNNLRVFGSAMHPFSLLSWSPGPCERTNGDKEVVLLFRKRARLRIVYEAEPRTLVTKGGACRLLDISVS